VVCAALSLAQSSQSQTDTQASSRTSQPEPTFIVRETDLQKPITVIAYGDMRFTDPSNLAATNTTARRALVARVAREKPDALLLNGDLTMHGGDQADYAIYQTETKAWAKRTCAFSQLSATTSSPTARSGSAAELVENISGVKGSSLVLGPTGTKLYVVALDSNDSLLPGSRQHRWLKAQIASLPKSFEFVFITMHHEPVADIQLGADDNPRPNEMALAELLKRDNLKSKARFVVVAGHIHNYERFEQDGVVYLVSGGGEPRSKRSSAPNRSLSGRLLPQLPLCEIRTCAYPFSSTRYNCL